MTVIANSVVHAARSAMKLPAPQPNSLEVTR